jgi:hypothetical protein
VQDCDTIGAVLLFSQQPFVAIAPNAIAVGAAVDWLAARPEIRLRWLAAFR